MKFKIFRKGSKTPKSEEKPVRFRILVVGRANAGKTSILKKLCGDAETRIVHDAKGKPVQIDLDPTLGRGVHNVEHEITYPNHPAFVFHDSRGFEAGSDTEMELLKAFIAKQCSLADVNKRLHVIWYCIAADDERPLPPAELKFFEFNTGQVPIIAVFTKSDALESKAYSILRNVDGLSEDDAEAAAPAAADDLFQKHYLPRLKEARKQPVGHVRLQDIHKPQGSVAALIDRTAAAVGSQRGIQELFILAQEYELKLRTTYGIPRVLLRLVQLSEMTSAENVVRTSLSWLPHVWDSNPLSSWQKVSHWDDFDYLSMVPAKFVSACASNLAPSMTNFHSTLCLVAGVFMVADRVFWASKRAEVRTPDEDVLLSELQAALALYRSVDEEAVRDVITKSFASSSPTDEREAREIGKQLSKLIQELCNATHPEKT